jgi:hypothetical protein
MDATKGEDMSCPECDRWRTLYEVEKELHYRNLALHDAKVHELNTRSAKAVLYTGLGTALIFTFLMWLVRS